MFTLIDLVVLVGGIAIGVLIGHFTSPSIGRAKQLRAELDHLLEDHQAYKTSVNAHFRKTADLVSEMTRSYAAVYDHLAGGARQFCEDAGPETKVPFGPLPGALASPEIETVAAEEAGTTDSAGADVAPDEVLAEAAAEATTEATIGASATPRSES